MPTTFRPYQRDQLLLQSPDVREWRPSGHPAHHISDLVDALDLSAFYAPYEGDGRRNVPYEPSMMVKVSIYAYATGCFRSEPLRGSSRRMWRFGCSGRRASPSTARFVSGAVRRAGRGALTEAGYAPLATGDHGEFAHILETQKPALVLLDLVLPGTDGIELMGQVPALAHLPVLFVSGYGRDETVARACSRRRGLQ